jgi:hypothetical protein
VDCHSRQAKVRVAANAAAGGSTPSFYGDLIAKVGTAQEAVAFEIRAAPFQWGKITQPCSSLLTFCTRTVEAWISGVVQNITRH